MSENERLKEKIESHTEKLNELLRQYNEMFCLMWFDEDVTDEKASQLAIWSKGILSIIDRIFMHVWAITSLFKAIKTNRHEWDYRQADYALSAMQEAIGMKQLSCCGFPKSLREIYHMKDKDENGYDDMKGALGRFKRELQKVKM